MAPEVLFNPSLLPDQTALKNSGHQMLPLAEVMDSAIQACPIDYRRALYENIVLSGGSTSFKHFHNRLSRDVGRCITSRFKRMYGASQSSYPNMPKVHVHQNVCRQFSSWYGASMWAAQDDFIEKYCFSREQYLEYGPSGLRRGLSYGFD